MLAQQKRNAKSIHGLNYNEVIVDGASFTSFLPTSIIAQFVTPWSSGPAGGGSFFRFTAPPIICFDPRRLRSPFLQVNRNGRCAVG